MLLSELIWLFDKDKSGKFLTSWKLLTSIDVKSFLDNCSHSKLERLWNVIGLTELIRLEDKSRRFKLGKLWKVV